MTTDEHLGGNREASSSSMVEAVCEGQPREMGFAQGAALRDKIVSGRDVLSESEVFRLKKPWWMPFPVYYRLAQRRSRDFLQVSFAGPLSAAGQRLAGIADGARCRLNELHLFNALEPVLSSAADLTVPALSACSAVAVRGRRSATGAPMIAKNFDFLPLFQPLYVIRDSRPTDGLRSLDFTTAAFCGSVDGMNEQGLCITYNYAYAADPLSVSAPISMLIADAIQHCRTVAEATERIASHPRSGAGLLMLADSTGDIASLELSNTRSSLRRPSGDEDILFHSNRYRTAEMREVEVPREAVYSERAPTPLRGRRVLQSPEMRDRRLADLLAQTDRFGPDELAALMADHGPTGQPDADTICMHSSYWATTACLQFHPRSGRMRIAYDFACSARYTEIEL